MLKILIISFISLKFFNLKLINKDKLYINSNICFSFLDNFNNKQCISNFHEETNFEVFVPLSKKTYEKFKYIIKYLSKITTNNIYIATSSKIKNKINILCKNCRFLDENKLFEKLSIKEVQKIIFNRIGSSERAGWYFQQFLKMSFSYLSKYNYYLVFDADTIPKENIQFFNKNSKPYFDIKQEFNKPYFLTLKKLVSLGKEFKFSFISEHMMINKYIMQEFIDLIEKNKNIYGINFFEKILYSINKVDLDKSGFSEYESYGTYASKMYPNLYKFRKLRTLRKGIKFLGSNFNKNIIKWGLKSFDLISFENWDQINKKIYKIISKKRIRKKTSLRRIVKKFKEF